LAKLSAGLTDAVRKVIVSFDVRPVRRATVEMVGRAAQATWDAAQWVVDDATRRGCFSPMALSDLPLRAPVATMLARWMESVERRDAEAVAAISQELVDGVGPRFGRGPSE
jgi:hypothetical protein